MKFKKLLCVFLSACIGFVLFGCNNKNSQKPQKNAEQEKAFSFVNVMTGDDMIEEMPGNNVIARIAWQKLKLSDEHRKLYPALSKEFDKYNQNSLTGAKALMYEISPIAKEMEGDDYNPVYCGAETELYLQRADNVIVSLLEVSEKHTGGVHPDYYWYGRNFDTNTGKNLELTDVLTDIKDLPAVLEKKISKKYSWVTFSDLKGIFDKYKAEDYTWTIDYQGVTFWFSPYDIASYSVGTLSAKIWFDELPHIFKTEYMQAPENYVLTLPAGHDVDFDLNNNDSVKDSVYIEKKLDKYGSYNMLCVKVNDKSFTDETNYAYDFDVYLARIGNKNYIYSDSFSDNDYHMFCTWDINGTAPKITQELYGVEVDREYIEESFEEGTVYKVAFNNPEYLKLEKRYDILGTSGATATFKLDLTDGKPQMTDKAYTFVYGHDVKTAISLDAELLPEMKKTQIPAGTLLSPYQTDGENFVDLKTENGAVIRLSISGPDWPIKVNGIPQDDCFEELFYAG